MKQVTVLGAGLVGKHMVIDLSHEYDVIAVDINEKVLTELSNVHGIKTQPANLSDGDLIKKLVADSDIVVGSVQGPWDLKC